MMNIKVINFGIIFEFTGKSSYEILCKSYISFFVRKFLLFETQGKKTVVRNLFFKIKINNL